MPATIRANIQHKLRCADNMLKRSIGHLADVHYTVDPQHPAVGAELRFYMMILDGNRRLLRNLYEEHWGTTEVGLWELGDLQDALDSAKMILDPKHGSRKRC